MFVVDNKREGERLCGKWNEGWWMGSQRAVTNISM